MRTAPSVGVILSSAAVAAVGAVGVWMGLTATSVPTVDLGDSTQDMVVVSTDAENAVVEVEWRLRSDGTAAVTVSLGFDLHAETVNAERGTVVVELWCDARLRSPEPGPDIELVDDGDEALCADGAIAEGVPARQIFVFEVTQFEPQQVTGTPVRDWSATASGQRTARSPALVLGVGGIMDEALPVIVATPAHASTLTTVFEATPKELIDVSVRPAGEIDEAMSVAVQSDGERLWTDSVTWRLDFAGLDTAATLEAGLTRWTDPGGQTFTQLLLLLSGALIGVAASLAVERMFSWLSARAPRSAP